VDDCGLEEFEEFDPEDRFISILNGSANGNTGKEAI
jgi:hypothetical protein